MKNEFIVWIVSICGSVIAGLFGGWTIGLSVLCLFMLIDFITGIIAATMGDSPKSPNGGISSKVIWIGIIKKLTTLVMCVVAAQLDKLTGFNYIRDTVVIAYIITETISIIENAGLIGIPIPSVLEKVIDILKANNDKNKIDN